MLTSAERRHSRIVDLEGELSPLLGEVKTLLELLSANVTTREYREARMEIERLRCAWRNVGRRVDRLSALEECERRAPRPKASEDVLTGTKAARKAAAARARPCPPDREECSYSVDGGACTITAALTVPARGGSIGTERISARYCLVDIDRLHTSHEPLRGFEPDPKFPAVAQERDYRQTAERAKVEEIAEHYDPALIFNTSPGAVDGVPVATEDRIVLGGNGRTMATRLVYAGRTSVAPGAPRQFLVEHAHEFGLDPAAVEAFDRPMLVRTVRAEKDPRALAEWSRRLNTSLSQQLDSTRLAVSRARFVDEAALGELAALGEDETLAAFLASGRSRGFVRALQRVNVIDGRAAQLYLGPDGLLNDQGRDLVTNLLVASLLPNADLISAYGRGPVASLARAAPAFVQTAEWPAFDLRPAIQKAVRDRIMMRAQDFQSATEYLRQSGLFGGAAVEGDPLATPLLHVLAALEGAPAKLARFARRYAQLAQPAGAGQGALFASETLTPLEALKRAATETGVKLP